MLSSIMEHTALRLIQHDFNPYPKDITFENLNDIKETCTNEFLNEILEQHPTHFKGFFILNLNNESHIEQTCENKFLTPIDFREVEIWATSKKNIKYTLDYYRIDTLEHILLFNLFQLNLNKVLHGLVFDNTLQAKVNLMQFKQNNLMRDFI